VRITERRMMDLASESINQGRARVARSGEQLTSGERVTRASDDPAAWAQARRADASRQLGAGRAEAIARSQERLDLVDGALATIGDSMVRARELALTAANATTPPEGMQAILAEVRALRQTALAAANTRSVDGEYIFSGSQAGTPAFDQAGVFQGDDLTRSVETSAGAHETVAISGSALTSAGDGPGIFAQLDALEAALVAGDRAAIGATIDPLRAAEQQVNSVRAEGGAHSSALVTADEVQRSLDLSLAALEVRLVGADPITAATELAQHSTALQAAQTVASRIIEITRP
jgi:flagellar hook-associated protein 3 FlgL